MKLLRKLWHLVEYGVLRAVLTLIGLLPLSVLICCADAVAFVAYFAMVRRRRISIDNILNAGVASTPAEARRIARASFRSFLRMVLETVSARRRITPETWHKHIRFVTSPEGDRLFHQEKSTGILIASAHIGNWEVVARTLSMIRPMVGVYRPFNNPYLDRYTAGGRAGDHLRLVSKFDVKVLSFARALAGGDVIALMIDQHQSSGRVRIDFFGRPAWTTKSVALLHLLTGAPILVTLCARTGPLQYEVIARGPFRFPRTGDREHDSTTIMQALTREVEEFVRKHPEQYMWGHRRWR